MENCVVLVPTYSGVVPECETALKALERMGYPVRRVGGYAAIDQARNQMASDAVRDGFEETLWIDADLGFEPEAVEKLRAHNLPICAAVYPKKGRRELAISVLPGTEKMVFGAEGGLTEIKYAATGFLHVRRTVYETMRDVLRLPTCNTQFEASLVPYFLPMVIPDGEHQWYLAEDYAFCERARQCGFQIYADTTIRLRHFGTYGYSWEDAGCTMERYDTYHLHFHWADKSRQNADGEAASSSDADPSRP